MRSFPRPFATAAAGALLVLSLTACGDDGDGSADDRSSESTSEASGEASADGSEAGTGGTTDAAEFCAGVVDIVEVTARLGGEEPDEEAWGEIQDAYADLGEIGLPDDAPDDVQEGFEVAIDAITGLSYDEAKAAFGDEDGSDEIPGMTPEENEKAEAFFAWATTACPDLSGGGAGSSPADGESVTASTE